MSTSQRHNSSRLKASERMKKRLEIDAVVKDFSCFHTRSQPPLVVESYNQEQQRLHNAMEVIVLLETNGWISSSFLAALMMRALFRSLMDRRSVEKWGKNWEKIRKSGGKIRGRVVCYDLVAMDKGARGPYQQTKLSHLSAEEKAARQADQKRQWKEKQKKKHPDRRRNQDLSNLTDGQKAREKKGADTTVQFEKEEEPNCVLFFQWMVRNTSTIQSRSKLLVVVSHLQRLGIAPLNGSGRGLAVMTVEHRE